MITPSTQLGYTIFATFGKRYLETSMCVASRGTVQCRVPWETSVAPKNRLSYTRSDLVMDIIGQSQKGMEME